jgi:hypothetical protein
VADAIKDVDARGFHIKKSFSRQELLVSKIILRHNKGAKSL